MSRVSCRQTPRLLSFHLPIPHLRIHHLSRCHPIRLNPLHRCRFHCRRSRCLQSLPQNHFQPGRSRHLWLMVWPCD